MKGSPPFQGGVGALLVSSGRAAKSIALLNISEAGNHIVSSPSL
jgi:O-acetylhomoserine (thiol)-lyase